ncbi:LytR C-terminal domain-containing protein [Actinomyces vulturis]|uniref:LytR C-terminal domain-containing protein n=1 Tax=Actinomyces vulturis TaxID=1857645 RepID=UPI00082FD877|nr:LytR C-terminal domain-containing protein [Actinomyces vulturis]
MKTYDYPEDEFDVSDATGPIPVGVHRARVPMWRSWLPLLLILVIAPALAWGAVSLLGSASDNPVASALGKGTESAQPVENQGSEQTAAPTEEASVQATPSSPADDDIDSNQVNFSTGITIHNGTTTNGLATRSGDKLKLKGFSSVDVVPGVYEMDYPSDSTVFYASENDKTTAEVVARLLGIDQVIESADEAQSNPIVVVLRAETGE